MQIIFQIIFSLFAIAALGLVWRRRADGLLSKHSALWLSIIWLAVLALAWYPNSTQVLADILGIGRGVDLVTYCALAFLFFTIFRLTIKIESLQRDITKVVRRDALEKNNI